MKWGIIILVSLGLLAAFSAAVLVGTLRASSSDRINSSYTDVVLAAKSLPAISVITSSYVTKDTIDRVSKSKLPKGYLTNPVQAIGRVLAVPVVEGQILTESCFVADGTGAMVAASLPSGMRAVSVELSDSAISGGLLYPGCVVDVLVSFKLPSSKRGEAISTTLLRGIQVLAVQGTSIVSKDTEEKKTGRNPGHLTVTLMVNPRQAEALQLATNHGTVSVALRNPQDKSPVDTEATVLNQGTLAMGGSAVFPQSITDQSTARSGDSVVAVGYSEQTSTQGNQSKVSPAGRLSWPVTVIRGYEVYEQDLDMP